MAGRVEKETFQSQIGEICKKNKVSLHTALQAILEAYNFADWAVIAKAVDGHKVSFWEAGTGESGPSDRDRAGALIFEMEDLKDVIIQYFRKRQA